MWGQRPRDKPTVLQTVTVHGGGVGLGWEDEVVRGPCLQASRGYPTPGRRHSVLNRHAPGRRRWCADVACLCRWVPQPYTLRATGNPSSIVATGAISISSQG